MFCTKCGQSNPEGAAFCSACGNALSAIPQPETAHQPQEQQKPIIPSPQASAAQQNQQGYYYGAAQQPYSPQGVYTKKKSRTGLIVGLCVGGALLVAAVVVLLFVWPGFLTQSAFVNGFWYSEDRGEALEFKNNNMIRVYTTNDEYKGDYTYDRAQGIGLITVEDEDYRFAVTEDGVYVESMGNYKQADTDFDVDDFIDDMWPAFNEVDLNHTDDNLTNNGQIDNNNTGGVTTGIQGLWYETTGYGGTLELYGDGTYDMTIAGYVFRGTYEYDASSGAGTLYERDTGETYPLTVSNGVLETDGYQYTRDYVEQYDWSDLENVS